MNILININVYSKLITNFSNYDKSNIDFSNKIPDIPNYIVKYKEYKVNINALSTKCKYIIIINYFFYLSFGITSMSRKKSYC